MLTIAQMRAARALLGWHQAHLADAAGLSVETIKRMEKVGPEKSSGENMLRVYSALQSAGVEFIPGGVRLSSVGPA